MRALFLGLLTLIAGAAYGQTVSERAVAAVELAGDGEFEAARSAALATDPLTLDVVTWLRLRAGEGVFADYQLFVTARADWPGMSRLRAEGERKIEKGHDPAEVLRWFGDLRPQTGIGAVRLAEALIARGQPALAEDIIQTAWRTLRLTDEDQLLLVEGFGDVIAPLHNHRVDALLWRWRTTDAERMLPLLSEDHRKLAQARLAYIQKSSDLDEAVAAVPQALRDTPGLYYDRYNWLAERGNRREAIALLRARSTSAAALGEPFRWSGWRRVLARWAMRQGEAELAYELAANHFLTDGSSFADLEWIAGFVALTDLDDAARALTHFEAARAAVTSPISIARMEYWKARSQDALGQPSELSYRAAAQHQTAFYGLLASDKLGLPLNQSLTGRADADDWQGADVLDDSLVRAALLLLDAGERGAAVTFFVDVGKRLPADDLARLGALLDARDESFFEVLLGKTAVTQGVLVPSIYYPIHAMAEMDLPVDAALALSVARRESEFNPVVGSAVGALGLMQLMPATAQEVAGFLGEPYSRNRLTADWEYNARLGARYLLELQEQFGPGPVMIAAGYNAGPSRPVRWMDERGDPRIDEADIIDWIEHIPFRETRNYVMRVAESIPIYNARLSGDVGRIDFRALLIGEKPLVRPQGRPNDFPTTIRPVARP